MIVDITKQISDDSQFNEDHIKTLCGEYRNYILNSQYSQRKYDVSDADYQLICVDLENATDGDICGMDTILKSKKQIPKVASVGSKELFSYNMMAKSNMSLIDNDRFKYADTGRFFNNFIYATIMPDGYLYLKSGNTDFMYMSKVRLKAIFEDVIKASSMDCNVCEASCTIDDTEFPLEDAWIGTLMNLVVTDLTRGVYNLRETHNDAMDSSDDLAQAIQRYTNRAFKNMMRSKNNTTQDDD